jgi:hypothetical protein
MRTQFGGARWGYGRTLTGRWLAAAVVVPVVMAAAIGLGTRQSVEDQLEARTEAALDAAGITDARVSFVGVQGTIGLAADSLPRGMSLGGVERLLRDVPGPHRLSVTIGGADLGARRPG